MGEQTGNKRGTFANYAFQVEIYRFQRLLCTGLKMPPETVKQKMT